MKNDYSIFFMSFAILFSNSQVFSQDLMVIEDLQYEGAFIIPGDANGDSDGNYANGTIEYNPLNQSLFFVGHQNDQAIAELAIPTLVNSTVLGDLNYATFIQNYKSLLSNTPSGNLQNIDRVSGMELVNNQLFVNGVEYYDANADVTHTTMVVESPNDLQNSSLSGYYEIAGRAHFSGWMTEVPIEWQQDLGNDYLAGNSSRYPINSRLPMGITAFGFDPISILEDTTSNSTFPSTAWLDFDLSNSLYDDYSNQASASRNWLTMTGTTFPCHTINDAQVTPGNNELWTEVSEAVFGFIVPGTRSYLTVGASAGHFGGIGYKATQDDGNCCGGDCPYEADDVYNYYWLWDVNDLIDVKNGVTNPYDVRPYAYGNFDIPFQYDFFDNAPAVHPISGGTFDSNSGLLYLTLDKAGRTTQYGRNPVIVAYSINNLTSVHNHELNDQGVHLMPNPAKNYFEVTVDNGKELESIIISNSLGQEVLKTNSSTVDTEMFQTGVYFVRLNFSHGVESITKKLIISQQE